MTPEDFVGTLPLAFQACRAYNHTYDLGATVKAELAHGLTAYHLVCSRCGTRALDVMKGGQRMWPRTYEWPAGYARPKDVDAPSKDDYRASVLGQLGEVRAVDTLPEHFQEVVHRAEDANRPRKLVVSKGRGR